MTSNDSKEDLKANTRGRKRKFSNNSKVYSDSSLQISVDVYKSIALLRPKFLRNELRPGALLNKINKNALWKDCVDREKNLLKTKKITNEAKIKDLFDRCIQLKEDIPEADLDDLTTFADNNKKFAGEHVMAICY